MNMLPAPNTRPATGSDFIKISVQNLATRNHKFRKEIEYFRIIIGVVFVELWLFKRGSLKEYTDICFGI